MNAQDLLNQISAQLTEATQELDAFVVALDIERLTNKYIIFKNLVAQRNAALTQLLKEIQYGETIL